MVGRARGAAPISCVRLIDMKVLRRIIPIVVCLVSCGAAYDLVIPEALRGDWENVEDGIHVAVMSDDIRISFYEEGRTVSIADLVSSDSFSYDIVSTDTSFSLWHLYKSSEGFSFNLDGDELVMKYALEEGDGLSEVRLERQGG